MQILSWSVIRRLNSYRDPQPICILGGLETDRGKPVLAQDYTVASDTRAVFRLVQYLEPLGTKNQSFE